MSGSSTSALNALNFFMADVRDGLGPFLGVFLQSQNWSPSEIGLVMTIGGLAGVAATTPLGALVDSTKAKRAILIAAALAIIVANGVNYFAPTFLVTATAQIISGIAAAAIVPAIAGLTLGIVRQKGYAHQLGRNEAYNHGGNAFAAVMCGVLGYYFGFAAVFALMTAMAVGAIGATMMVKPEDIDHQAARGLEAGESGTCDVAGSSSLAALLTCKPLVILALTMMLFHLANGAMLPILGQAMVTRGTAGDASAYTAATVIIAQLTMVPMALIAARIAQKQGYWLVLVMALIALPIRGLIAGYVDSPYVLVPVQVLDGVGAGLLGVAVPGLVARILAGTGRVNVGLGAVMTLQGVGAALSTTVAGYIAQHVSYEAAFLALAGIAAAALALWLAATAIVAPACGGQTKKSAALPATA